MMADGTAVQEERQANQVRRTLSLLPALVGLFGVAATVIGCVISGLSAASQGLTFTALAAALVGATVLTGGVYGMYLGLFILTIGALVAGGDPTTREMIALLVSIVFIHEVVRFSLDSRRPSRFGPGVITSYVMRAVLVIITSILLAWPAMVFADSAPDAAIWVPVGLAAAGLPLFVRPFAGLGNQWSALDSRLVGGAAVRAVLATTLIIGVLSLAVIAAEARGEIGSGEPQISASVATTTTLAAQTLPDDAGESGQLPSWFVVLAIIAVAVMVYFIMRRPEAVFQLEETDRRDDDNSFDLAIAATADADEQTIDIDDEALAKLLLDLQLDIEAERDPGRAIRFGYAKIEHRLSRLGLVRSSVETEREFLTRALPTLGSTGPALTVLTGLFERARFGLDPIDESMRQQALVAIDELAAAISAGGPR